MTRECLPRNEAGQMTGDLPDKIGNRVEEFVKQLCKEFPTVDFFDMESIAIRRLSFALSMTMLAEDTIRQRTREKN